METTHHEMNLFDLTAAFFRAIGRFLKALFRLGGNSLRIFLRKWYISLPLLFLCIAGALYWSRPANRLYKVGTMVKLNGPHTEDLRQAWQPLQFAVPDCISATQSLPALLGISAEDAFPLQDFACLNVIDYKNDSTADVVDFRNKHNLSDTTDVVMPNYLYLQFRTRRPQQAQEIGKVILSYLNNHTSLQRAYENYVRTLQREAVFCRTQIEILDSLTTAFYFEQGTGQQIQRDIRMSALVVGEREINLLHEEILQLIAHTKKTEYELSTATAPVVTVSDFTIDPRPVNGRLKCLLVALLCGYVTGCISAWTIEEKKRIALWLKRK